jgi:hypothetical protein
VSLSFSKLNLAGPLPSSGPGQNGTVANNLRSWPCARQIENYEPVSGASRSRM